MENIKGIEVKLSQSTLDELNQLFQPENVKGERYTKEGMKGINM